MLLPTTSLAALLLLIFGVICWGSWANTQKLAFKWRFELFYCDFAVGVALCAAIAAFTLGSMNSQELTFSDNLVISGMRRMAYCVAAGVIFNLANMLLLASISLSGLAVAFPLCFGVALAVTSVMNFSSNPQGSNAALLFGGAVIVLVAILVDAMAYRHHVDALAAQSKHGPVLDPRTKRPVRSPLVARGLLLGFVSGILMGFFMPLVDQGRGGENGVGPYGFGLLFGAGLLASTIVYVPFFMNFPAYGDPLLLSDYFKGTKRQHVLGILGGILWMMGFLAVLAAGSAPPSVQPGPGLTLGLIECAAVVSLLWGFFAWGEFRQSTQSVKMLLFGAVVIFLSGVVLVSIAPMYAAK